MSTYTITATLDGDDAWEQWTDLLTQPRFVEDGTLIVPDDDDPANPDTVWHSLTLATKQAWIDAMYPQPPVEGTCSTCGAAYGEMGHDPEPCLALSDADLARIVDAYVELVRGNTTPAYDATTAVLDAIRHNGYNDTATHWEIVMELSDTAHDAGITGPDYDDDPDGADAFNNRLYDALPLVVDHLKGTTP